MGHETANVNGINIHYVKEGNGYPVLFFHGWPGFWYTWRKQIPVLSKNFQVIVPDLRGSGDSDKPSWGYDARTLASDMHELARALGHSKVAVVAISVGTRIAQRYCLDYESEVDRVVLIDTPPPLISPSWPMEGGDSLTADQARAQFHNYFHCLPELPERLVEGHEDYYLRFLLHRWSGGKNIFTEEELSEYVRNYRQPGALRGGFNLYRSAVDLDVSDWVADKDRKISVPLLCMSAHYGEFGGQSLVEAWRHNFPNIEETSYSDVSHFPNEEVPEQTNRDLLAYLSKKLK